MPVGREHQIPKCDQAEQTENMANINDLKQYAIMTHDPAWSLLSSSSSGTNGFSLLANYLFSGLRLALNLPVLDKEDVVARENDLSEVLIESMSESSVNRKFEPQYSQHFNVPRTQALPFYHE